MASLNTWGDAGNEGKGDRRTSRDFTVLKDGDSRGETSDTFERNSGNFEHTKGHEEPSHEEQVACKEKGWEKSQPLAASTPARRRSPDQEPLGNDKDKNDNQLRDKRPVRAVPPK